MPSGMPQSQVNPQVLEFLLRMTQSMQQERDKRIQFQEQMAAREQAQEQLNAYRQEQEARRQQEMEERAARESAAENEQAWRIEQARENGWQNQLKGVESSAEKWRGQGLAEKKLLLAEIEKQLKGASDPKAAAAYQKTQNAIEAAKLALSTIPAGQPLDMAYMQGLSKGRFGGALTTPEGMHLVSRLRDPQTGVLNMDRLEPEAKAYLAAAAPKSTLAPDALQSLQDKRDALQAYVAGGWQKSPQYTGYQKQMEHFRNLLAQDPAVAQQKIMDALANGGASSKRSASNVATELLGTIAGRPVDVPVGMTAGTIKTSHGTYAVPTSTEFGGPGVNSLANGGRPVQNATGASQEAINRYFDAFNASPNRQVMFNDTSTTGTDSPKAYRSITNQQTPTLVGSAPRSGPPSAAANVNQLPHMAKAAGLLEGPHKAKIMARYQQMSPEDQDNFADMVSQRHGVDKQVLKDTLSPGANAFG